MEVVLFVHGYCANARICHRHRGFITYSSHYLNFVVVMSMVVDLSMNWFEDSNSVCSCVVVVFSIRDTIEFVFDLPSKCLTGNGSQGDFARKPY